jgi:alpha-1,6-mannosyltransferase
MPAADRGGPSRRLLLLGAVLLATTLAGPVVHLRFGDLAFIGLALAQGCVVLLATRLAERCAERRGLAIILGVAVALRLVLLPVAPHLSTDAYRYVWDGRVQAAGINPYRHVPAAPELAALRDDAVFPHINRKDYAVTIYPPAAQLLFLAVNGVSDGLLAMKLAMVAAEAVTIAVLILLLRHFRRPASRVVAYAWHPLAVWEIAGNAHVDAVMVAAMMFGLWVALVSGRRVAGVGILAVAALIKPFAALALPAAWRPWDWRAPLAAVAVVALLYLPYLSVGTGVFGFMPSYLGEERIADGGAFWLVASLQALVGPLPWMTPLYLALAAPLLGALMLWVTFGDGVRENPEARLRRLFWLLFTFLLLLSPDYPWYYLLLLPFVALFGPAAGWAATIGGFLLYDEVGQDPEIAFALRDTAFNLAVLAALLLPLWLRGAAARVVAAEGTAR